MSKDGQQSDQAKSGKMPAESDDESVTDRAFFTQLIAGMKKDMQQQIQTLQSQVTELTVNRVEVGNNTANTLPTPMSTTRQVRFSDRGPNVRRLSFGVPSIPAVPQTPGTPATGSGQMDGVRDKGAEIPRAPAADRQALKDALQMSKGRLDPFYGDMEQDKNRTVMMFVEKFESVTADCELPPQCRLTMLRFHLEDGALRWLNRKLEEMEAADPKRSLDERPFDWDNDIRHRFIEAFAGTDTVELWLAKLSELQVGKGRSAASPIELESKFDAIARHIYPHFVADNDRSELLLATKYSEIILSSQPRLYEQIVWSQRQLRTLKDWKEALAHAWTADERIKAAKRMQKTNDHSNRGGWVHRGRGRGGYRGSAPSEAKQQTVNSVHGDDTGRPEGQEATDEEYDDQQLNAASGARGGQGGRGGRGRGRGGAAQQAAQPTRNQTQSFKGQCWNCGEDGHRKSECPNAGVDVSTQQSKG